MLSNIRQFDPRTKRNYRIFEEHSIIPLLKYAKDPDRHQIPIRVFQVGLSRTVLLTNSAYILGIEAEQEAVTRHIQLHLIDNGGFHCKSDLGGDQVHDDVFAVVEFDPEHFSAFIRKSASPVEKGAAACASRSRCFNDIVTQSAGDEREEDFMTGSSDGDLFHPYAGVRHAYPASAKSDL